MSQALEISRRVLGPEHPNTLKTMNSLASTYAGQAKYAQAESLYSQTLEIARRVLGPEHPDTLRDMNNLGSMYNSERKYAQAEAIFSEVLEIRRRVLGPEHPDTMMSMYNLAIVYERQSKYAQAEAILGHAGGEPAPHIGRGASRHAAIHQLAWPSSIPARGNTRRPRPASAKPWKSAAACSARSIPTR